MKYSNGLRVIDPKAQIGANCTIMQFSTIEADVVIGDNCWVGPNVTIMNGARIGDNVRIFPGAVISAVPQDLKYKGETTYLHIGNGTTVREHCTLNKGTAAAWKTVVGENCLLMAYTHVAHDCVVGNHCILANNTTLAGHIEIEDYAILGGMTAVHQFERIGESAMIGGGSLVRKDVPPFIIASREPLCYQGVNRVGLERRGFSKDECDHIHDIYRILFVSGLPVNQALLKIEAEIQPSKYRDQILDFVRTSKRGIVKSFRAMSNGGEVLEPSLDN